MKEIKLNKGMVALVDDDDFGWVCQWRWRVYTRNGLNYAYRRNRFRKVLYMHREILHSQKGEITDHVDGNGLNNQKNNLRICTHAENMRNRRPSGTSRYLGVCVRSIDKDGIPKYVAQITVNRKTIYLGVFKDETLAALTYNTAALKYNGEFARLNAV
jgi:hypothetical protein